MTLREQLQRLHAWLTAAIWLSDGALPAWVINIEVGRTGWRQILADGASVADVEAIALQACPGATVGSEVIARMGGRTYVRLSVQPA